MSYENPVPNIKKRIKTYINTVIDNDADGTFVKLKYTVIRVYFTSIFRMFKSNDLNASQADSVAYFKKIVFSRVIDGNTYEFPERIDMILNCLEDMCKQDAYIRQLICEWNTNTFYF